MGEEGLTAVNVPGKKSIVTIVIACMDELSCDMRCEVARFVALSSCVTILKTYPPMSASDSTSS